MEDQYFETLMKALKNTEKSEDVPVSSLILDPQGNVASIGWNTRQANWEISNHAEINALNNLTTKIKSLNLDQYTLLTTLEPCQMCYGAIKQTKIKQIKYLVTSDKYGIHNHFSINDISPKLQKNSTPEQERQYQEILETFFKKLRHPENNN
ncbi:cytosine deaminase/tRNA(adenine34) deaminase [Entomoplasma freundtii]|uniref:tRNA-specific adenosine deaminase n=1 Tax=Entomoplasma freundtii TaxID=74700 RepID=A0A2K8NVR7_9MOLU|nr:nucleoside deaminase [Entomoplasma freundtii]ATZ16723.1 tRNA-specific adenosine deaminase [Entomoplasma freundtii]TDY58110.1 cytosine deaminase/tRNA(adenine34) deaminase [Entomoplasma freundtii]